MSPSEKRSLQVWLILILIAAGIVMVPAVLLQSLWLMLMAWVAVAFDLYWFYIRYYKRKRARYPMAPLPGEGVDAYFPRTNIPRPIYADAIKMQEKHKELAKIKKARKKKK